ncbi:MAG: ATP-binding protein [Deltaproteobacteria bacterium]|nr:ATP-binding protein [Deltaproteobacteria bacterium]
MKRNAQTDLDYWLKSPDRRPLVIRGARQVGKSTLVRMFAADAKLDLIEINLERHLHLNQVFGTLDIDLMVRAIEDTAGRALGPSSLLFLDEIQATPNALAALRYFYEDRRELAVIAAGSLLELALPDIESSMPVGRIDYLHLGPLTLVEYMQAQNEDLVLERLGAYRLGATWSDALHERLTKLLATYMQVGGMPEPLASYIDTPTDNRRWMIAQQRIVDTYQDDFNKYKKRGDWVPILQELYRRLPGMIGRKIKYTELAPGFRVEKIRQALDMLAAARIVYKAPHATPPQMPLSAHASQKVFKTYWLDIGLLVRTVGSVPSKLDGAPTIQGLMAEQFVAQHLAYLGASHKSPELYYWLREGKTDNAEVDFLAPLPIGTQLQVVPIEVKFGSVARILSLKQYLQVYRPVLAVRLYQAPPKVEQLGDTKVASLPLYMTPFLSQILSNSGVS